MFLNANWLSLYQSQLHSTTSMSSRAYMIITCLSIVLNRVGVYAFQLWKLIALQSPTILWARNPKIKLPLQFWRQSTTPNSLLSDRSRLINAMIICADTCRRRLTVTAMFVALFSVFRRPKSSTKLDLRLKWHVYPYQLNRVPRCANN